MTLKEKLNEIIFGYSTPAGRTFDLFLIAAIMASVLAVLLDSVATINARHQVLLDWLEWGFTGLFTVEYLARLYCSTQRRNYSLSFYGLVDLLSVLPTYLALLLPGASTLLVVRILRVLRIFRILKLMEYSDASQRLLSAVLQSGPKIFVFFAFLLGAITIFGALMYLIEGAENGFTSIPRSMYWAVVTMTTVGFGDISPQTPLGQTVASIVMLLGYSVIAVPTGILTNEIAKQRYSRQCKHCGRGDHEPDARFCRYCGAQI